MTGLLGYKYDAVFNLMKSRHGISINLWTLKRRLAKYNLSKKNNETDEEEIKKHKRRNARLWWPIRL